jgi:ATP-binding cassette subfamily C protein
VGVITPVLSGRVVNAITAGGPLSTIGWLAGAIAALAIAEAVITIVTRWLSSRVGEGLIFDLRTAVYDHVQTMPIAFFNRTRTGALVSRLNTDVIGAQRAFSNTLSGVVSNAVSLILTVAVMVTISWQVTVLSILLLPVFLIPARMLGGKLAALQFEAADHNAAMSTRMTERFSAGGATLVRLFGDPGHESREFALRAGRVRDIGVRVSMLQATFVTALTLVSALALALVYGLGGWQAVAGSLDAGRVVTLAMLLTRLYGPLTMLANARMDIMSAVASPPAPSRCRTDRCPSPCATSASRIPPRPRSRSPPWKRSPPSMPGMTATCSTGSTSRSRPVRRSPSWARPGLASRPSPPWSRACTT